MGMGFAPTWLRQMSPPVSQNHFNHWSEGFFLRKFELILMPQRLRITDKLLESFVVFKYNVGPKCTMSADVMGIGPMDLTTIRVYVSQYFLSCYKIWSCTLS